MADVFQISRVDNFSSESTVHAIRRKVFIEEQAVPEHEEWDEYDNNPNTIHLSADTQNGEAVGTLRLVFLPDQSVKVSRIAVLESFRGKGVASELLRHALKIVLCGNYKSIFLHAQVDAIDLYKKFDFVEVDDQFLEAGIVHQKMAFHPTESNFDLIFGNNVLKLENADDFIRHIRYCALLGRRQMLISSESLREDVFSDTQLVDAISAFVRSDKHTSLKILLRDGSYLASRSAPLKVLAQKLPSKVQIQVLNEQSDEIDSFISVNHRHLVFFNDENTLEGFCSYKAAPECQSLRDKFEHHWAHMSAQDPNLAQLSL